MPDNNFYLLRANINNDYLENHVWSKCGRKYGFEAIDHSNKSLSYNTLHYTCGRVVEIFRKQKFYGFQVRKPYRIFKTIVVSIITFFKRDSSIIRFLIVPNSVQLKLCVTDDNITVFQKSKLDIFCFTELSSTRIQPKKIMIKQDFYVNIFASLI